MRSCENLYWAELRSKHSNLRCTLECEKPSPIEQFPSLFRGLGKLEGEYSIKLQEGAKPFALTVPRRVAIPLMKQVKAELMRMEQLGVITRVSEPTE